MKRVLFSFTILLLIHLSVTAQTKSGFSERKKFRVGARAGLNFTSYSSLHSGIKTGFMAGVWTDKLFNPLLGLRNEINYAREGFNFGDPKQSAVLNVNALATINFEGKVQLLGGPQITYAARDMLNNAQGVLGGDGRSSSSKRLGVGTCIGATIGLSKYLSAGVRYNMGFYKIKPAYMTTYSNVYKTVRRNTFELALECTLN